VHDCHPEFHKQLSLKRLSEGNGNHLNGAGILNGLGSLYDAVRNKKVATIEMLGPFERGSWQLNLDKRIWHINNGNICCPSAASMGAVSKTDSKMEVGLGAAMLSPAIKCALTLATHCLYLPIYSAHSQLHPAIPSIQPHH